MGYPPIRVSRFFLTRTAWRELEAIWQFIAHDSRRHADLVEEAILDTCRSAAELPKTGHKKPGIRNPQILFLNVAKYENYSIAYLAGSVPLRVVRVMHGARDVRKLFRR